MAELSPSQGLFSDEILMTGDELTISMEPNAVWLLEFVPSIGNASIADKEFPNIDYQPKVFPNPTSNFLTIQHRWPFQVAFYSISGQKIQETKSSTGKVSIDTEKFDPGVYVYKLIDIQGSLFEGKLIAN